MTVYTQVTHTERKLDALIDEIVKENGKKGLTTSFKKTVYVCLQEEQSKKRNTNQRYQNQARTKIYGYGKCCNR